MHRSASCGASRHEFFITPEAAAARKVDQAGFALFPTLDLYDMHADKAAWKPWGRLWKGPGPWAMVTGYLSEPSESAVIHPGTDWTILRMRLGEFRRYAGRSPKAPEIPGQILVPRQFFDEPLNHGDWRSSRKFRRMCLPSPVRIDSG